ncbi:hypothetical protein Tco_0153816 [Tanacetum coccineum]
MKDEEKILYQKAKVKWLSVGDRNNAYFHKVLKSRNHECRINTIHDDYRNKYEGDDIVEQFVRHFKKFLGKEVQVKHMKNINMLIKNKSSKAEVNEMNQDELSRGKAKVTWNAIYRPKSRGGLGLKELGVWSKLGRLQSFISYRDICNARLKPDMVVKDLVVNEICIWPFEWDETYPNLRLIQNVVLDEFKQDEMDSHKHLLFECKYSTQFWNRVKRNICLRRGITYYSEEKKRSIDQLYEVFIEIIRLRLSSLKAKLNKAVTKAQLNWNIKMGKRWNASGIA